MRFQSWKRFRVHPSPTQTKSLRVEKLESRVLLHATGLFEAHALFAPGTSAEYAGEVHRLAHQVAQDNFSDGAKHVHGEGCCCPDCSSSLSSVERFQFDDASRWSSTSQSGGGLRQGDRTVVTWSVVPDGTPIDGFVGEDASASNLVETFRGIYGLFHDPRDTNYAGEAWFEAIASSFERWSDVSGLEYVYEPYDDGASFGYYHGVNGVRGDVRIGGHTIDGNSGTLAYNFFPNTSDMVIDTADAFFHDTRGNSLRLRNVIAHEAGHGMGLSHVESSDGAFLMEPFINLDIDGPQFDDILATHRAYGDALEGNDTYRTATNLGFFAKGDSRVLGADGRKMMVDTNDMRFVSIDDDSDVDFYRLTISENSKLDVLVTPVGPTYNQGPQTGQQSVFVASEQNDLRVELYDQDGTTRIRQSNVGGLGASEQLRDVEGLSAGDYYVAVRGTSNAAQMYQLQLQVTEAANPGVTIVESNGLTAVREGGSRDSYSVVLDSAPSDHVTITLESLSNEISVDRNVLYFDSSNWNIAQTVTITARDDRQFEGDHRDWIRHSMITSAKDYRGLEVPDVSVAIRDNDTAPENQEIYFSLKGGGALEGLSVSDEDIVAWNGSSLRTIFDGSDVGLAGMEIDAFDVISETEILMSFTTTMGSIDDSDILYFRATRLGETTAGQFYWYVDGSDLSLTSSGEDIDAIAYLDDGSLLLSTSGTARMQEFTAADEDVFRFVPSALGRRTAGTFEPFLDGSDANIQLNSDASEDVDGVSVKNGSIYLTTVGNFRVPGVTGADDDVFVFDASRDAFDSKKLLNLTSDDLGALDFPGIASASSLGLGRVNALTHPQAPFEMTEVSINRGDASAPVAIAPQGNDDPTDVLASLKSTRSALMESIARLRASNERNVSELFAAFESFVQARWKADATTLEQLGEQETEQDLAGTDPQVVDLAVTQLRTLRSLRNG